MNSLILQPTTTAEWQALVKEAEQRGHVHLSEDLESYLIFLLIRFTGRPELIKSVVGMEFLQSSEALGQKKLEGLRDVGDKSLLLTGFFPGRAQSSHVRISYFVKIGQSAYAALATLNKQNLAKLYVELCQGFVVLMDVLHTIREQAGYSAGLTPLQAEELWSDLSSPHALEVLRRYTKSTLIQTRSGTDGCFH